MKYNSDQSGKHHIEQIDILAYIADDTSGHDTAYINSRIVSENIVAEIMRSLKLLDRQEHHNKVIYLKDLDSNKSFGALCGLATSQLTTYSTICVEINSGRHLIIKDSQDRIGKFLESSTR